MQYALEKTGFNQAQLAEKLGVSRQSVWGWKQKSGYLPSLQAYRFIKLFME